MPLYEYSCERCEHRFEILVREDTKVECPKCRATQVKKLFSIFGLSLGGQTAPKGGGGGG